MAAELDRFGASAPGNEILQQYGLTVDNVCARAQTLLAELRETSSLQLDSTRGASSREMAP